MLPRKHPKIASSDGMWYCSMVSPPILTSEVVPPAQVVNMVVVDVFAKGDGLILSFDGMMNVILLRLV